MKLYLSSYHLGSRSAEFGQMFTNKKVGLISNALDFSTDAKWFARSKQREIDDLRSLGLEPEELDLRRYFNRQNELAEKLSTLGGIWMQGGNTFILRKAMATSGLDNILQDLRSSDFVVGGYSAGACVLTPTLRGIDLADEPERAPEGYQVEPIWDGLGLVSYSIAPHYKSDHDESALVDQCVQYFIDNKMLFIALRDGDDIIAEVRQ